MYDTINPLNQTQIEGWGKQMEKDKNAAKQIKSSAKAVGIKSAFVINNDELLITSFGNGNKAVIEGKLKFDECHKSATTIGETQNLENITFDNTEKIIKVQSKRIKNATGQTDDPLTRASNTLGIRQDVIGHKAKLEEKYFGNTFDDNIHIQLIYNILDIEKILAVVEDIEKNPDKYDFCTCDAKYSIAYNENALYIICDGCGMSQKIPYNLPL